MPRRSAPTSPTTRAALLVAMVGALAATACKGERQPPPAPAPDAAPGAPYAGPLDVARLRAAKLEIEALAGWAQAEPLLLARVGKPRRERGDDATRKTWHWAAIEGTGDAAVCIELIAGRDGDGRLVEASLGTAYPAAGELFKTCSELAAKPAP